MSRPLMQLGIMEMESLFAKSRRDMQVLRNLEAELQHRQVPRARNLLERVRAAVKATTPTVASEPATVVHTTMAPSQSELGLSNPAPSDRPVVEAVEPKPLQQIPKELPSISLVDAYRLLKASPGSSWESIEFARRQLVQRASPEIAPKEQRTRLQEEADRINNAYKAIVVARAQCQ